MRTYWQAESYKGGELHSISFERRDTKKEAIIDAVNYLSDLGEFDKRHITAAVCEWTENDEGEIENTGNYEEVTL